MFSGDTLLHSVNLYYDQAFFFREGAYDRRLALCMLFLFSCWTAKCVFLNQLILDLLIWLQKTFEPILLFLGGFSKIGIQNNNNNNNNNGLMVIPQSGSYITIPTLKEKLKNKKIKDIYRIIRKKNFQSTEKKKTINFVSLVLQTLCFLSELLLSV